ncbi:MAG: glycosyltransferase family 2 protein [Candidatus Cohnella colombiensis]|uniref:Glycosyltransferase family 2 protein n=1 Tax=Candidatus Cohnella colombiensis TaxID=3121368 RepID=A0AA95EVU6_9BACL|nr:MAG: glycosyltransferase family 2 protein [Cohnella sp.]
MIVRNEEAKLQRCLSSVAPYVDEMIIVDTGSTDQTIAIATMFGAKIAHYEWINDFAAARNYALSLSSSRWNIVLDADEYIEQFDVEAINQFMQEHRAVGRIHRISETMEENEHNYTSDYITRLIPVDHRFKGRIHEQVVTDLPRVNVPIVIQHDGYLHLNKSDRNIPILQLEVRANPNDPYYYYQLAKEYKGIGQLSESMALFEQAISRLSHKERYAPNVFVEYMYVLQKMQQYEFLIDMISSPPNCVHGFADFHFACGVICLDVMISNPQKYMSLLPLIEQSYRRCLEIGETEVYDTVRGTGSYAALYNLGNYYEVLGQEAEAIMCYQSAAQQGYQKAKLRILDLTRE